MANAKIIVHTTEAMKIASATDIGKTKINNKIVIDN